MTTAQPSTVHVADWMTISQTRYKQL